VKFTARTGAGAGVGWAGADKSQWHFAVGQQSIPRDEGCLQETGEDWHKFAGTKLPMSENASSIVRNLRITCISWA
jgi:hypothetical protein